MSKLVPVAVLGIAMGASACAHHDKTGGAKTVEPKVAWRCPEGTYPDLSKDSPNCLSHSPWAQNDVDQAVQNGKRISFSCPEGSFPDSTKPMPNCLSRSVNTQAPVAGLSGAELDAQLQAAREEGAREAEQKYQASLEQQRQEGEQNQEAGEGQKVELQKRVAFATSSTTLTPDSKATLNEVAETIKSDEDVAQITVEGHADNTGTPQGNVALSEQRAQTIKEYLEQQGVPSEKIETVAFGADQPIASNDSAAGRALNRSAAIVALK